MQPFSTESVKYVFFNGAMHFHKSFISLEKEAKISRCLEKLPKQICSWHSFKNLPQQYVNSS